MNKILSSRERVLTALDHKEPDRVPLDLGGYQSGITTIAYEKLKNQLGINRPTRISERNQQLAVIDDEVLKEFGIDTRYVFMKPSVHWDPKEGSDENSTWYVDEWGAQWKKPHTSFYYDPVGVPLKEATIEDLRHYPWPDPNEKSRFENVEKEAQAIFDAGYALGTTVSGVFEQAWYLVGLERIMIETIENPSFVEALLDQVLAILSQQYSRFLEKIGQYLTFIEIWEDISSQQGPLTSPNIYRKIIKPRTRDLIQVIKSKTKAKVALHSCGSTNWAIDDFIEIGIQVLNPVQVSAAHMDTKELKKKYGNSISFWGGIDTQRVLPRGTTQEVEEEVTRRIDDLGEGGGYLLAPVHNIQPDVPPENIIAMYQTGLKHGRYHN